MDESKYMKFYLIGVLSCFSVLSLFLFSRFFYKAIQESYGEDDLPVASDSFRRPVIMFIFSLTFLSIATYAVFMLGIQRLNTRLMIPWALVIGFKCITGGILLILASFYVPSSTLFQGIFNYSTIVLSFLGIYYCYMKVIIAKKVVADRMPILDNLSIISLTNEKPKQFV